MATQHLGRATDRVTGGELHHRRTTKNKKTAGRPAVLFHVWQPLAIDKILSRSVSAALAPLRDARGARRGEPHALDAIINEGTLTIGWIGPALLGILIAAFGCPRMFSTGLRRRVVCDLPLVSHPRLGVQYPSAAHCSHPAACRAAFARCCAGGFAITAPHESSNVRPTMQGTKKSRR